MKWNQVPWGALVTGIIAIYGAGLSTYLAWRQSRRDVRNMNVKLRWGIAGYPDGARGGILTVEAANSGYRPIEVQQLLLRLTDNRSMVFPEMQTVPQLPNAIAEGHMVSGVVPSLDLATAAMRAEIGNNFDVRGVCRDSLGREYVSEALAVDLTVLLGLNEK